MACACFKIENFWKFFLEIIFSCINVNEFDALPLRSLIWEIMGHLTNDVMKLCWKFAWNLLNLKASRTCSKMDDIAGGLEDAGRSWLGLVSLMTLWMVCKCPEGALFIIWLNSVELKGIKNTLKDGWHCWRFGGCWTSLTGACVLDQDWDMSLKVLGVSV